MTSTWKKNEWTAFTEEDLLNAGSDNGSSIGCGDKFTMPGSASVTMSTWDNDSSLSGDYYENANDSSGQYARVDGARVGSQMYAESYHVLYGSDGKTYYLIEIEVEGYDAPGTGDDFFTFYGKVPPAGVELTVAKTCNVKGCWVDYSCLGAGDTAPANTPPTFTNLPENGIICVDENTTFVIDSDATDADGDTLTYEIVGGRDAAFFEIDAQTGELKFIGAPDYEDPQSGGDNNTYDVTIKVSDDKGGEQTKALWVKVKDVDEPVPECIVVEENITSVVVDLDCGVQANTDVGLDLCAVRDTAKDVYGEDLEKPSEYTLSLGDVLTDEINSSQGDKLEVGAVMVGDDGDGTYFIKVSRDGDASKNDTIFFAGDVDAGDSFTASAANAGGSFGSETFVHIFSADGGTLLQTINFHTSCSAPLVIGDQYGSITLSGAALEGKDTGQVVQIGGSGGTGDDNVEYEITGGADAALFEVDLETGEVSFITPPDYENPLDAGGNNNYEVEVTAYTLDASGNRTGETQVKPVEVCVEDDCIKFTENGTTVVVDLDCGVQANTDVGLDLCAVRDTAKDVYGEDLEKPSEYTLSLGDVLTDEINSSQGDKLEVGAVMAGDDGDGTYFIKVSRDGDASKNDTIFFAGDVDAGDSFTASAANAGGSFGSETFVHIFSADGGTLLQTINFHTSCSAPLVIGDQYGSITLSGAALEGKDTGQVVQIGGSGGTGDDNVEYEITGGADAALFEVDLETGEVSFITPPDYENPLDAGGNNNYEVEVTAYTLDASGNRTGETQVKPVEVCVEDDCIKFTENGTTVVVDLDCGVQANTDVGLDLCAVRDTAKDVYGEDLEKPSEYTLSLGDVLTDEINSSQGDKLEVGAVMAGDDGDGTYFIKVSRDGDASKNDTIFFAGDVDAGDSFTASAANAGGSFGSETFVHIFSADGGTLLQTINFHTSCSAPLVIGDQYGSITLSGAALEGKDTGQVVQIGGSGGTGDDNVEYEITGGADAALFEVDLETGEVSFITPPDYENPLDAGGNNNYEVEVTAYTLDASGNRTGETQVKPIEVCVENEGGEVGSLSGRYFIDVNNNDVDDGEPGVEGVLVELLDENGAGTGITTTTADDGSYYFGDLAAGTYGVKFTDGVSGLTLVDPNQGGDDAIDSDAIDFGGSMSTITDIIVVEGADTPDNDAGVEDAGTASVGDYVWFDANGNGLQDGDEDGIEGVSVTLTGAGNDGIFGTADDTTETVATDVDGKYLFENKKAGEYKVTFDTTTTAGLILTAASAAAADVGADDSDADETTGMTSVFTLSVGEAELDIDAGYVDPGTAKIGDKVFFDTNGNGQQDFGEAGVNNIGVTLYDADGLAIATTTTMNGGMYLFDGLAAGDYSVGFDSGDTFVFTDANQGADETDSDADTVTGRTGTYSLAVGEANLTVDAGLVAANDNPEPMDNSGETCADEKLTLDVLNDDSDPDGDALTITAVDGQAIAEGETIETGAGTFVSLVGGQLVFDGEAAYASLDIGESDMETISYTVSDGNGGTASANVEVTFCGDANTLESLVNSLPASATYQVTDAFATTPIGDSAYDLLITGTGDVRLDDIVFEQAYCLSFTDAVDGAGDFIAAPANTGDIKSGKDGSVFNIDQVGIANGVAAADNLDLINWILAQDYENNPAGSGDGEFNGWEVQLAIWELTDTLDAGVWGTTSTTDFVLGLGDPAFGQESDVDFIVSQAIANGEGFMAGDGDIASFIVDPNPASPENSQPFIVAFDFDQNDCIC